MPRLSVSEAAARLGVSPIRVRQRIEEGSLVAEKVGDRWLVDLSVIPSSRPRGRPVKPEVVWDAIRCVAGVEEAKDGRSFEELLRAACSGEASSGRPAGRGAPDMVLPDGSLWQIKVSPSAQRRAQMRLCEPALAHGGQELRAAFESLLRWLGWRANRHVFRVAPADFDDLRSDSRLLASGLSHRRAGMQDPRVVEAYVSVADLDALVADYWLDPPGVDAAPNVFLHVAPGRPTEVSSLMLAADLWEHGSPRAVERAVQLVQEVYA